MATVMSMRWKGVTPEQYDEARRVVDWEGDVADGGLFHIAAFKDGDLLVTDLWESGEQFQRFVESRLMPVVKQIGIEGEPEVELYEAHRVFAPGYEPANA